MTVLIKIIQVVFALSLLIIGHELGHFLFARLFKIRVEKFYLFFDWGFRLFRFKPKNSDTEYGIGWLPLGGYCKISGMIDESMDKEQLAKAPEPWEFRAHPAWQRFFVISGGVIFNILIAFILYGLILFTWGEQYIDTRELPYGVQCTELAERMGFRNGDRILDMDGRPCVRFNEIQVDMVRNRPQVIHVLRGEDTVAVTFDEKFLPELLNTPGIFAPRVPFVVGQIPDSTLNVASGLLAGDRVVALNGTKYEVMQDIQEALRGYKNQTVAACVVRGTDTLSLPLQVNGEGRLEVYLDSDMGKYLSITVKKYGFFEAFPAGAVKAWKGVKNYWKELGLIVSPKTKAYKSVGSFIAIGSIFPSVWNWEIFWNITAWLSIMLAVLNILPIPALDGGHLMFCLFEMITGRKPGDRFVEYAQMVGMGLLLLLMVFAFGNDIVRLFNK